MAEVFPFPSIRRLGLIRTCVVQMRQRRPEATSRLLLQRAPQNERAMLARGLPLGVMAEQRCSLENAIGTMYQAGRQTTGGRA
jgi:hypothetical protein